MPRKVRYSISKMSTVRKRKEVKKIDKLRKREYHPKLQIKFDELHAKSKEGINFNNLMPLITSADNIMLAVRTIKTNKGRNTKGANETIMDDILKLDAKSLIDYIRNRFRNYQPHLIKRVYIEKENSNKKRPLGIPTMEDRLIQQCILQVLEPIAEAKFVHQSFGFRPHRSVHHAHARVFNILNATGCTHVVDMDIKSFFDNVSHSKLIKQLYTLGIHDKALLTIIKRMLKAGIVEPKFPPFENDGTVIVPDEGTPQGGILSPLLANIVLNEFDHWVVEQWEKFETRYKYTENGNKHRAMRTTKLKEMFYVRYADDFRIFTTDYKTAEKIYHAVDMWLKERLKLEISQEKSSIINLKNKNMKFLGITFRLIKNPDYAKMRYNRDAAKYITRTSVTKETFKKMKSEIRKRVIKIKYTFKHEERIKAIQDYNAYIRGLKFYSFASEWSSISSKLNWNTRNVRYNRLKRIYKITRHSRTGEKEEGKFEKVRDRISVNGIELLTSSDIKHNEIMQINPKICKYTEEGRKLVHDERKSDIKFLFKHFEDNWNFRETVEYNVNRIAALSRQQGLCAITGQMLKIGLIETHHKKPIKDGGTNATVNLYLLNKWAHIMIHAKDSVTLQETYKQLEESLTEPVKKMSFLKNLNKFRKEVGNDNLKLKDFC